VNDSRFLSRTRPRRRARNLLHVARGARSLGRNQSLKTRRGRGSGGSRGFYLDTDTERLRVAKSIGSKLATRAEPCAFTDLLRCRHMPDAYPRFQNQGAGPGARSRSQNTASGKVMEARMPAATLNSNIGACVASACLVFDLYGRSGCRRASIEHPSGYYRILADELVASRVPRNFRKTKKAA